MTKTLRRLRPAAVGAVRIEGGFWGPRIETNRAVTIPHIYRQFERTGSIDAWRGKRRHSYEGTFPQFWDSDIAKWMEAAAYVLESGRDAALERRIDRLVGLLAKSQWSDGYVNTYFTLHRPGERWANLRDMHELYCGGHLIEAAVAYAAATGKKTFLDVMRRFADHVDSVFGRARGKRRGYPGHEEIELALVRLYHATGEARYVRLAEYFVNERGRAPSYFEREARQRGETGRAWAPLSYYQAHAPVREQRSAEGHSVRAMYLYSGMADVAAETGDRTLLAACRRLWRSATRRRMYVTGGVGSAQQGERFTFDYDLPNESAYAETCAAIGLVFFAHRMLQIEDDGEYGDVMERALYNGVLSGVSLDGTRFAYANPLAVHARPPGDHPTGFPPERQEWFPCPCCPPNIARLLASLGRYVYSTGPGQGSIHLYVQGGAELEVGGQRVLLEQRTEYPWHERVDIFVTPERPARWTLALRIPGWCRQAALSVNGRPTPLAPLVRRGYARLTREWQARDRIELRLPMPVERVHAHPRVWMDAGRVALQRGPLVYCAEEVDNGRDLSDLVLPRGAALRASLQPRLLGGAIAIEGRAQRSDMQEWGDVLYRTDRWRTAGARLLAVPYALWGNRQVGEMAVWIREG